MGRLIRGEISPLRPSASGRNDKEEEKLKIRHRTPGAPPVRAGEITVACRAVVVL